MTACARRVLLLTVPGVLSLGVLVAAPRADEGASPSSEAARADQVSFGRDVRPILVRSCLACHGFDPSQREAGLRIDTFEHATSPRPGGRTPAIVPGDPDASLLIQRVTDPDPARRMRSMMRPRPTKTRP